MAPQQLEKVNIIPPAEPQADIRQTESSAVLSMIERASRDPAVDVGKLSQLLELRDRTEARQAERDFSDRMNAAQSEMGRVAADANNQQTRSRYASYPALDRALRPIYTKHGFTLSFNTEEGAAQDYVRVVCYVSGSGHSRKYHIDMPADGKGAKGGDVMTRTHATGSAVSYGMRYLLKMIFNVAVGEDDDDGNAAGVTVETISPAQLTELADLIAQVKANKELFCKYFRIESLAELPAKDFTRAIAALNAKRGAK